MKAVEWSWSLVPSPAPAELLYSLCRLANGAARNEKPLRFRKCKACGMLPPRAVS